MKPLRRHCLHAGAAGALAMVLPPAARAAAAQRGDSVQWPPLRLLDGSVWTPASWQGSAAVVVFWATWCPFCEHHNAHVDKLHRAVAGQPLRVLGVAIDGDATSVGRYMAHRGYSFPVTAAQPPDRPAQRARHLHHRPPGPAAAGDPGRDVRVRCAGTGGAGGQGLTALKGDRRGQHSIRINAQWRLCFVWTNDGATAVEIVDYQ